MNGSDDTIARVNFGHSKLEVEMNQVECERVLSLHRVLGEERILTAKQSLYVHGCESNEKRYGNVAADSANPSAIPAILLKCQVDGFSVDIELLELAADLMTHLDKN